MNQGGVDIFREARRRRHAGAGRRARDREPAQFSAGVPRAHGTNSRAPGKSARLRRAQRTRTGAR